MWLAMLVLVACGCNAVFDIDETGLINDNPRTLVFDNRASATDLIDFPVPVLLDATRVDYSAIAEPSTDLRFYDPATEQDLPFEIETWNPAGDSVLWVRVPRITAGSAGDHILMYFGADAGNATDPLGVFADYGLVLHGAPGVFQSAPLAVTASAIGVTSAPGAIGPSLRFGGTGNHQIRYTDVQAMFDRWSQFTVELWLYADYATSSLAGEPRIIEFPGALTDGRLISEPAVAEYVVMQTDVHFVGGTSYKPTFVPLREWVHMLYTFDGEVLWIYRNGALSEIDIISSAPVEVRSSSGALVLGSATTTGLEGLLDEVRISRAYRTGDWIDAQYRAMRGSFVTFQRPGEPR